MEEKNTLPPQVRKFINRAAHRLAKDSEAGFHARLTEQARLAVQSGLLTDAMFEGMAMTEADWQRVTMTDEELLAYLASRATEAA